MISGIAAWTWRQRVTTCGLAIGLVALLVGAAFWLTASSAPHHRTGGTAATPHTPARTSPAARERTSSQSAAAAVLPALRRTDDPVAYAREVAGALFDVSPAVVSRSEFLQFWRDELPTVVYSDAATNGLTLAAQNADAIDNLTSGWIPPQAAWGGEAADDTSNRLTITSVSVPDYWVNDVADGEFRDPGLHMERVMGVLTQSYGASPANRYTSSRSVVIDLGLWCGPTQPGGCRLVAPQPPPELGDS